MSKIRNILFIVLAFGLIYPINASALRTPAKDIGGSGGRTPTATPSPTPTPIPTPTPVPQVGCGTPAICPPGCAGQYPIANAVCPTACISCTQGCNFAPATTSNPVEAVLPVGKECIVTGSVNQEGTTLVSNPKLLIDMIQQTPFSTSCSILSFNIPGLHNGLVQVNNNRYKISFNYGCRTERFKMQCKGTNGNQGKLIFTTNDSATVGFDLCCCNSSDPHFNHCLAACKGPDSPQPAVVIETK